MGRARRIGRLLVPIFIGGFARADLLSTAMHTRCYRGGRYRTKLRQMKATATDWAMLALVIVWMAVAWLVDRKSTRLNSSHANISYAVFCLKKKKIVHGGRAPRLQSHTST